MNSQSKNRSTVSAFLSMTVGLLMLTACGNQNAISTSSNDPGVGATGVNVDIKDCQVGQVHSSQFGCLTRGNCQVNAGMAPNTNQCVTGQAVTEQIKFGSLAGTKHYGRLAITNLTQTELLLQRAKLCNSTLNPSNNSMAMARCTSMIQAGAFAIVKSFSTGADNVNLTIGIGTSFPADLVTVMPGVYSPNMSNSSYLSFSQQATNSAYNNRNGMQIVGVTPDRRFVNLIMLVDNGNLGSDRFQGQLVYEGVEFAKVTFDRY